MWDEENASSDIFSGSILFEGFSKKCLPSLGEILKLSYVTIMFVNYVTLNLNQVNSAEQVVN